MQRERDNMRSTSTYVRTALTRSGKAIALMLLSSSGQADLPPRNNGTAMAVPHLTHEIILLWINTKRTHRKNWNEEENTTDLGRKERVKSIDPVPSGEKLTDKRSIYLGRKVRVKRRSISGSMHTCSQTVQRRERESIHGKARDGSAALLINSSRAPVSRCPEVP